jgi:succinate dehydrogenase flavin-adding protein (antitoxin of CptAB toxin-antitoxin module)
MFTRLTRLPGRFYTQFSTTEISSAELEGVKKQLLWRARQRGLLELDVILGSFADKNLKAMTASETQEFEKILALESPDLFKLLSGQIPPSSDLTNNSVLKKLMHHVFSDHPTVSTP